MYSSDLQNDFPPINMDEIQLTDPSLKLLIYPEKLKQFENWASRKPISEGSRNDTLTAILREGLARNILENDLQLITVNYCQTSGLPLDEGQQVFERQLKYHSQKNFQPNLPTAQKRLPSVSSNPLKLTHVNDLMSEPDEETEWILEDTLGRGGISIVAGKPKAGKTTFIRSLIKCIADGSSFLDRETKTGPILYFALEEKRSEIRKSFRLMGLKGDEDIYICTQGIIDNAVSSLKIEIDKLKPVLVIIDPLFRFLLINDANDYAQVSKALEPLVTLSREKNCHVMLVHHTRKGIGDDGDTILGSQAIFGAVDCALMLKRDEENRRCIYSIQRYGVDLEHTYLKLNENGMIETNGTKEEVTSKNIEKQIVAALESANQAYREVELAEIIKCKKQRLNYSLRALVEKNLIVKEGTGQRGNPYLYRLNPVPSSQLYKPEEGTE